MANFMEQVDGYVTKLEEDLHGLRQEEKSEAEDRCHMAALQAGGGQEAMQQVLHTHTISLAEVRKNLGEWREALLQEYHSLTVATKAVVPVKRRDLQHRQDVEYAPGKLVATIKAPSGKRKARIVVCGNRVEASLNEQDGEGQDEDGQATSSFGTRVKGFEHYASGTDGTVVRALLRKASHCGWSGATTDVRTAFLLAPRRSRNGETLIVRPPRVLVEAGVIPEDEVVGSTAGAVRSTIFSGGLVGFS